METFFLQPGFRFCPTDVELIMYYLRKKVNGKRFLVDAVAEVKVYDFPPWELKEKSCLPSRDLEWLFFCARDRKYASGKKRTNRSTKLGYWKTTGDDKAISHNSKTVGMRKTLIFYEGKGKKGKRTNWVMHEYRIEDDVLINTGFSKDSYVVCKIFQKSGRGPKNGEQHGAPFNEDEWDDYDSEGTVLLAEPSSVALGPEASQNLASNRTTESIDEHNSVVDQLMLGPEPSENLAMNGTEESVDVHNHVLDQQSGASVVTKVHDSNIGYDDIECFNVNQLLSEIDGEDGSCNEQRVGSPIPEENGNEDVMHDGHEIYRNLGEIISNEELDACKGYNLNNLPFIYDPNENFSIFRDGSFLEEDDLEPMQDDLFGNGTADDSCVHSSTLNIPVSQEVCTSSSNWEPQDAIQYLPALPTRNVEEIVNRYIPPSSARGECLDEPLLLDCIASASATAALFPHLTSEGYSKNVLSYGSMLSIQAELIQFSNKSSQLHCICSYHKKLRMEHSLLAGRSGRFIHLFLLGSALAFFLRCMFTTNIYNFEQKLLFNNKQLCITKILDDGLHLCFVFRSELIVYCLLVYHMPNGCIYCISIVP